MGEKKAMPVSASTSSFLVALNLVREYPVKWSRYSVLRDFVQNFYDAVGREEWSRRFHHDVSEGKLTMRADGVGFSHQWLVPIGASTKRAAPGRYAGHFGEGFKIACLCAARDHRWNISMSSQDWQLDVVWSNLEVDGTVLCSLAYRVRTASTMDPATTLTLTGFGPGDEEPLEAVLQSFYYAENPLLGPLIWESRSVAIHERSKVPKPRKLPSTSEYGGEGIIFAGYQARGSLPHPLVFCVHDHLSADRERRNFHRMDVMDVIRQAVTSITPVAAAALLRRLKVHWLEYPKKRYDFYTWHHIIGDLVKALSRSSRESTKWRKEYPHLLVTPRIDRTDIPRINRRREARAWLRSRGGKYRLVQKAFTHLGYPTLEEVCDRDGGFSEIRDANARETPFIEILADAVKAMFPELERGSRLPPCKVIDPPCSVWQGVANCIPRKEGIVGLEGMRLRSEVTWVALQSDLFTPGKFGEALGTYLHELAHQFGGDGSASFSRALTYVLERSVQRSAAVSLFSRRWDEVESWSSGSNPREASGLPGPPEKIHAEGNPGGVPSC